MTMGPISILLTVSLLANFIVFITTFLKAEKGISKNLFFTYLFGVFLWGSSILIVFIFSDPQQIYVANQSIYSFSKITFLGPIIFFSAQYFFVKTYPLKKIEKLSFSDISLLLFTIVMMVVVSLDNTLFVSFSVSADEYVIGHERGFFTPLYSLFLLVYYIATLVVLYKKIKSTDNRLLKIQRKFLWWSIFIFTTLAIFTNWILSAYLNIPQLSGTGPVFFVLWAAMVSCAIFCHKLFNVVLNIERFLEYFLPFLFYFLILSFLFRYLPIQLEEMDVLIMRGNILRIIIISFVVIIFLYSYSYFRKFIRMGYNMMMFEKIDTHTITDNEKNSSLDDFSAMVSHELRNALSCSLFALEDKDMKTLESSFQNLQNIVDNLEYFSDKEIYPELEEIDMKEFFTELSQSIELEVEAQEITFKKSIDTGIEILKTDKSMLFHILMNLLKNAIKFTPKNGEIQFLVLEKNNHLIFEVKDNGVGIAKDNLSKIFERYYTSNNTTGKGIGLYICKKFAEVLGGSISVESEENKGAVFVLMIPKG
jgi:signal transduction histidine kinase